MRKATIGFFIVLTFAIVSGTSNPVSGHSGLNDSFSNTTHPSHSTYVYGKVDVDCNTWTHSIAWSGAGGIRPGDTSLDSDGDGNGDDDADGLCDDWENPSGIGGLYIDFRTPATAPLGLTCADLGSCDKDYSFKLECSLIDGCPDPAKRDLYVELDWMRDSANSHKPAAGVIDAIKTAFNNNPPDIDLDGDGTPDTGDIVLHLQYGELDPSAANYADKGGEINFHKDSIRVSSSLSTPPGFYRLKEYHFGTINERTCTQVSPPSGCTLTWTSATIKDRLTAKRQAFHYEMIIYRQSENTTSGWGEINGNDFVISLGLFTPSMGSVDQQKGTLMHELGHNLNLRHGGNQDENCKPNYLSVMSYTFQFAANADPDRPLDYSNQAESNLDENALVESPAPVTPSYTYPAGSPVSGERKVYFGSPTGAKIQDWVMDTINWDGDGNPTETTSYAQNINYIPSVAGCSASTYMTLNGYNDWANISFNIFGSNYGATGAGSESDMAPMVDIEVPPFEEQDNSGDALGIDFMPIAYPIQEQIQDDKMDKMEKCPVCKLNPNYVVKIPAFMATSEITYDDVRGFYDNHIVQIMNNIEMVDESNFVNGDEDKEILMQYATNAQHANQKDNLPNVSNNLQLLRDKAEESITDSKIKQTLLTLVDNKINVFEIAQDTDGDGKRDMISADTDNQRIFDSLSKIENSLTNVDDSLQKMSGKISSDGLEMSIIGIIIGFIIAIIVLSVALVIRRRKEITQ